MADNLTTQSATPATLPASTPIATREVTYSGDAGRHIAPVGIVAFSGSDDAKSAADIPGDATNGLDVDVTRVQGTVTVNVAQVNGVATTMGNGASGTGVQRVTLASDSTGNIATIGTSVTPGTAAANLGKAEDAVAANGDTGVAVLAVRRDTPSSDVSAAGDYATLQVNPTGSLWVNPTSNLADNAAFTDGTTPVTAVGFIFDETAGTALTENDIAAARINANRALVGVIEDGATRGQRAGVNASGGLQVTPVPHTAGGLTPSRTISAASTNATSVKASAGQVFGWYLYNANAAVRYLKLYNKASAPTVGTDTPVMTIPIPPGAGANVEFGHGIAFGTGIAFALTTGVADADTGAVAANEIVVNLLYK